MERKHRRSPFAEFLGIEARQLENGRAKLVLPLKEILQNSVGNIHGGVISAMADSTAAAAVHSLIGEHQFAATRELQISFYQPVSGQGLLCGEAWVSHHTERRANVNWQLTQDQQVVACGGASFSIIPRPTDKAQNAPGGE